MPALNSRRYLSALATLAALVVSTGTMPASATAPPGGLIGTWQVTRICSSGCTGTTTFTEQVVLQSAGVYQATGHVRQLLYPISNGNVLTHAVKSSSLLTVKVPGQTMRGPGLADDGSTFTVIWHCTASSPQAKRAAETHQPVLQPLGRAVC